MTTYKQFLATDVSLSPFKVSKGFMYSGSQLLDSDVAIKRYLGQSGSGLFSPTEDATTTDGLYQRLVYDSIEKLYYSNFLFTSSGDQPKLSTTILGANVAGNVEVGSSDSVGRYFNYPTSTLTQSRVFPTQFAAQQPTIGVLSIPSQLYGECVVPGTFRLDGPSASISDDGEGNLINSYGPFANSICGNIIYQHGIILITYFSGSSVSVYGNATYGSGKYGENNYLIYDLMTSNNVTCSFSSSYTVFETEYRCTINQSDFNYTLNPSAISGSTDATYYNFLTGSYFNPYVTTVGLYDENQDLIAVAKLAKPLPLNSVTDTTIQINLDR